MNRKSVKFPFVIKTVAVLLMLFLAVNFTVTYFYADKYRKEMLRDIKTMSGYLFTDILDCKNTETDSTAYADGVNTAQANAVLQYYKLKKLGKFDKRDVDVDIALYRVKTNDEGEVLSYDEAFPDSPVLIGNPYKALSTIVVFGDILDASQMEELNMLLDGADDVYAYSAAGYKEGRFFYPVEITVGTSGGSLTFKTDCDIDGKQLKNVTFDYPQVIMPDGTIIGNGSKEAAVSAELRADSEEDFDCIDVYGEGWGPFTEFTYDYANGVASSNYALKIYAKGNHLAYAIKHMHKFYIMTFLIFVLLGLVLINSHNHTIDKRMETEAKRRRMMDSMTHEMKTPLSVIRNYGEVLLEETDEEKKQRFTQNIIDEADRLNEAIISMLDLSKMEAGTYPMELSSISAGELVREELERKNILIQRKELMVELDIQEDERILADEKLVVNIISNFLSNGINHALPGSRLNLQIRGNEREVYVVVRNRGRQIPQEEMDKIWNSFYGNKASNKEGSGLGLAIVRNACLMHRGSYGCCNEEDGVTFWARICSMEENIRWTEMTTGPVLGITDTAKNKGLLDVISGIFILTLSGGGEMMHLMYKFTDVFQDGEVWFPVFYGLKAAVCLLVGSCWILYGSYQLFKNKIFAKRNVILAAELVICTVIEFIYSFWGEAIAGEDATIGSLLYFVSGLVELTIWIMSLVIIIRVFVYFIRMMRSIGNLKWMKICRAGLAVYCVIYMILMLMFEIMYMVPVDAGLYNIYQHKDVFFIITGMIPVVICFMAYRKSGSSIWGK